MASAAQADSLGPSIGEGGTERKKVVSKKASLTGMSTPDLGAEEGAGRSLRKIVSQKATRASTTFEASSFVANPEDIDTMYEKGKALINDESYEEALPLFQSVVKQDQEYRNANQYLELCLEHTRMKETEAKLEKMYETGKEYYAREEYAKALPLFTSIASFSKEYRNTAEYIEVCKEHVAEMGGQMPMSEEEVAELYEKGKDLFAKERAKEALAIFERITAVMHDYRNAGQYIEACHEKLHDTGALEQEEERTTELYEKGKDLFNDERYSEALTAFKTIAAQNSDYRNTKQYIEACEEKLGMSETAVAAEEEAMAPLYEQAKDLFNQEDFEGALKIFKRISATLPDYRNTATYVEACEEKVGVSHVANEVAKAPPKIIVTDGTKEGSDKASSTSPSPKAKKGGVQFAANRESIYFQVEEKRPSTGSEASENKTELTEAALAEMYETGKDFVNDERWAEALNIFQKIKASDPDYRNTCDYLSLCEEKTQAAPSMSEAAMQETYETAKDLVSAERFEEALGLFKQIQAASSEYRNTTDYVAFCEEKLEDIRTGKKTEEQASEVDAEALAAKYETGKDLVNAERYEEAVVFFEEIQAVSPGYRNTLDYKQVCEDKLKEAAENKAGKGNEAAKKETEEEERRKKEAEAAEAARKKAEEEQIKKEEEAAAIRIQAIERGNRERAALAKEKAAAQQKKDDELNEKYEMGKDLATNERFEEALVLFKEVEAISPNYRNSLDYKHLCEEKLQAEVEAAKKKAEEEQKKKDEEESLKKQEEEEMAAKYETAKDLVNAERFEEALAVFKELEAKSPDYRNVPDYKKLCEEKLQAAAEEKRKAEQKKKEEEAAAEEKRKAEQKKKEEEATAEEKRQAEQKRKEEEAKESAGGKLDAEDIKEGWKASGHNNIGKRVRHQYAPNKFVDATVFAYHPVGPLFRILHDGDDDEEDLDAHELQTAVEKYNNRTPPAATTPPTPPPKPAAKLSVDQAVPPEEKISNASSTRSPPAPSEGSNMGVTAAARKSLSNMAGQLNLFGANKEKSNAQQTEQPNSTRRRSLGSAAGQLFGGGNKEQQPSTQKRSSVAAVGAGLFGFNKPKAEAKSEPAGQGRRRSAGGSMFGGLNLVGKKSANELQDHTKDNDSKDFTQLPLDEKYERGKDLVQEGRFTEGLILFSQITAQDSDFRNAPQYLELCQTEVNKTKDAMEANRKAEEDRRLREQEKVEAERKAEEARRELAKTKARDEEAAKKEKEGAGIAETHNTAKASENKTELTEAAIAEMYETGKDLVNGERYEAALKLFNEIHAQSPDYRNTSDYKKLCEEKIKAGDLDGAKEDALVAKYDIAKDLVNAERYEEALKLFNEIHTLSPNYMNVDDYKKLCEEKLKATDLDGVQEEALIAKYDTAKDLVNSERYEEALKVFNEILAVSPDYRNAVDYKKICEEKLHDSPQKTENELLAEKYDTAKDLVNAGRFKEALKLFNEIHALSPDYRNVVDYTKLCEEKAQEGDQDDPKKKEEEALAEKYETAKELVSGQRFEEALSLFKEIQVVSPDYRNASDYMKLCEEHLPSITKPISEEALAEMYETAKGLVNGEHYVEALKLFIEIQATSPDYRNAPDYKKFCEEKLQANKTEEVLAEQYETAKDLVNSDRLEEALIVFKRIQAESPDYRNTLDYLKLCEEKVQGSTPKREDEARSQTTVAEQKQVEEAKKAGEETRKREAEEELRRIEATPVEGSNASLDDMYEKAKEYAAQDEFRAAYPLFKQVSAKDPNYRNTADYLRVCEDQLGTNFRSPSFTPPRSNDTGKIEERAVETKANAEDEQIDKLYEQGKELAAQENYRDALPIFRQIVKEFGEYRNAESYLKLCEEKIGGENFDIDACYEDAKSLMVNESFREALTLFKRISAIDPDYRNTVTYLEVCDEKLSEQTQNDETTGAATRNCNVQVPPVPAAFVSAGVADRVQHKEETQVNIISVPLSFTVHNVDYSQLLATPSLCKSFESSIKSVIASKASNGVQSSDVFLQLSQGSVIINASIRPPHGTQAVANAIVSSLKESAAGLPVVVAKKIAKVDGIRNVCTGSIRVEDVAVSSPKIDGKDLEHATPNVDTQLDLQTPLVEQQPHEAGAKTNSKLSSLKAIADRLRYRVCGGEDPSMPSRRPSASIEALLGPHSVVGDASHIRRNVLQRDNEEWLESLGPQGLPTGACVITSLPDWSEMKKLKKAQSMSLTEYTQWFKHCASLVLTRCPRGAIAIFQQTDITSGGQWIDKAACLCEVAASCGATLLWHKIVFDPLAIGCARKGASADYSHLLGFLTWGGPKGTTRLKFAPKPSGEPQSPERTPPKGGDSLSPGSLAAARNNPGNPLVQARCEIPDLLPRGRRFYAQGMGMEALLSVLEWLAKIRPPVELVVDPFCGRGTVLALANKQGLSALGVESDAHTVKHAERLNVDQLMASETAGRPRQFYRDRVARGLETDDEPVEGAFVLSFSALDFKRVNRVNFVRDIKDQFRRRDLGDDIVQQLKVRLRDNQGGVLAETTGTYACMEELKSKILDRTVTVMGDVGIIVPDPDEFSMEQAAASVQAAEERANEACLRAQSAEALVAQAQAEAHAAKFELQEARAAERRAFEQQLAERAAAEKKAAEAQAAAEKLAAEARAEAEKQAAHAQEMIAQAEEVLNPKKKGIITVQVTSEPPAALPGIPQQQPRLRRAADCSPRRHPDYLNTIPQLSSTLSPSGSRAASQPSSPSSSLHANGASPLSGSRAAVSPGPSGRYRGAQTLEP